MFCVMHLLACFWCLIATMQGSLRDSDPEALERYVTDCMAGACVVPEFNGACTGCVADEASPWHTEQTQMICDANPCLTTCEIAIMEAIITLPLTLPLTLTLTLACLIVLYGVGAKPWHGSSWRACRLG